MIFSWLETLEAQEQRLSDWHDFFCLIPREVGVKDSKYLWAWLCTIERKRVVVSRDVDGVSYPAYTYHYRLKVERGNG